MGITIAIGGGPCTGKSTLAAALFARLKENGFDYDLVTEESRKLKGELGSLRSPFERCYLWLQQDREERRSIAADGFITDSPLFQLYVQARQHATESRDQLAVRELFRQSVDTCGNRYQLIVLAEDPSEIPYRTDGSRRGNEGHARERHELVRTFVLHLWPERVLFVGGSVAGRVEIIVEHLNQLRAEP